MRLHAIALLASIGTAYAELHRCGTKDPDDDTRTNLDNAYANYKSHANTNVARDGITIDTYVNVVTTQAKSQNYSPKQIEEQVRHAISSS
jgi:hypothetical protein